MKFAFAIATVLVVAYAFVALRTGVPALVDKQREIRDLEQRNATLAREIEAKRERIRRLRDSQSEQELEIRQRLKLVRPGEKVFIIQDQSSAKRPPETPRR